MVGIPRSMPGGFNQGMHLSWICFDLFFFAIQIPLLTNMCLYFARRLFHQVGHDLPRLCCSAGEARVIMTRLTYHASLVTRLPVYLMIFSAKE
jgi:hypothetical protein